MSPLKRSADKQDLKWVVAAFVTGGLLIGFYVHSTAEPDWKVIAVIGAFCVVMAKGRLAVDLIRAWKGRSLDA